MTISVPHHSTQEQMTGVIDRAADELLTKASTGSVQIVDPRKSWDRSGTNAAMSFSFTGKVGYISVVVAGTVTVDDSNVTVESELPAMVRNFVGEDKVRAMVEEKLKELCK